MLHLHEIIHRDVTPGNLLLSRTGNGHTQVLIADLGVAKSMLDAVGATMTAGTPSYMAPEQAMGVASLDRRADIYSLTAVTYAMLTGHPPFLVRSIADILARDPSQPPVPIASEITEAGLLPATALHPSFFPPPEAQMSAFEPANPFPAPVGPPAFQPPQESSAGSYLGSGNPYPTSQLTTRRPNALTPSRSMSYYVLLGVSALALFAISMFLTILVLS